MRKMFLLLLGATLLAGCATSGFYSEEKSIRLPRGQSEEETAERLRRARELQDEIRALEGLRLPAT